MLILGIETSCDETAAAVLDGEDKVLSNIISSQVEIHRPYGGVVPEIASRKHMEWIAPVVRSALSEASVTLDDLDGISVTRGPGLIGSLLVGLGTAKAMAYAKKLPLVGIHHLAAHIAAIYLENSGIETPFTALVVSGGHTSLYLVSGEEEFSFLGGTRDDAAGEAFDKVAKILGLGYPGGPEIDRAARNGDPDAVRFPRALDEEGSLDFSFSGVKTAVIHHLKDKRLPPLDDRTTADIAASFQEAVVDSLVSKTRQAAKEHGVRQVAVTGGVACNRRLRARMEEMGRTEGIDVLFPSPILCTDNAAMAARAGLKALERGAANWDLTMNARSRWPLEDYHPAGVLV